MSAPVCTLRNDCICHECTPAVLDDMTAHNWVYRVEGAKNLVFAHETSPRLLRLANNMRRSDTDLSVELMADHRFVRSVLCQGPLRPYVMFGKLISVTDTFIEDLMVQSAEMRPGHGSRSSIFFPQRTVLLQKDLANLFSPRGQLTQQSTVCVEIKPKGGLTSISRLCPKALCDALQKFEKLDYAIKHYELLPAQNALDIPKYSPADFLSGEHSRILYALEAMRLQKASGFRIFFGGDIAVANDLPIEVPVSALNVGLHRAVSPKHIYEFDANDCFRPSPESIREYAYSSSLCKDAIVVVSKILAENGKVLGAILYEQGRDFIDASGAEVLWDQLVENLGGCEKSAEYRINEAYLTQGNTAQLCEEVCRARQNLSYKDSREALTLHCDKIVQEAMAYVKVMSSDAISRVLADFLTASVAKDCSLMISLSFRPADCDYDPKHAFVRLDTGGICTFAIHVVDIGPKPCSKIKFWACRDKFTANALMRGGDDVRRSVSAWTPTAGCSVSRVDTSSG
jgi:Inositol-pentakisphosphate 2-kinase